MTTATPVLRRRPAPLLAWRFVATAMGPFVIAVDELGRIGTGWQREGWPAAERGQVKARSKADLLDEIARRLERYFAGKPVEFDDLPLPDGTPFQQACWKVAKAIPRGRTISYADLARRAGSETGAARAAGQCMRSNPQPVIVPCHRVIASDGRLNGYAGTTDERSRELAIKAWLLRLEQ